MYFRGSACAPITRAQKIFASVMIFLWYFTVLCFLFSYWRQVIFFINLQIISQGNKCFVSLIIVHFTLFFFQFRNQVFASLLGLETDFVSFFDLYTSILHCHLTLYLYIFSYDIWLIKRVLFFTVFILILKCSLINKIKIFAHLLLFIEDETRLFLFKLFRIPLYDLVDLKVNRIIVSYLISRIFLPTSGWN